jgi:protein SCO1/2
MAATALSLGLAGCGAAPGPPPPSLGITMNRPVPDIPLVDQNGRPTSLAAFRGKVVFLAPFLTLCQEVCPITTGAMLEMERSVRAAGLGAKVAFAEVTVDPGRDSPERLAAYAGMAGVDWPLLTGTTANLAALWKFFAVYYQPVPEASPPGIDWWTHQPLTYDVDHSDGFIVLDQQGHERFTTPNQPDVGGRLKPTLSRLLDATGRQNLARPPQPAWSPDQGLGVIGWLLGAQVPSSGT